MCQKENHTLKKLREKLAMHYEDQFIINVIIATRIASQVLLITKKRRDIIVQCNVMQMIENIIGAKKNNHRGGEESLLMKRIGDGVRNIQKKLLISKQEDMREKETQKDHILWKNGTILKISLIINVRYVEKIKNLPKIILFHYQKVVVIIFQISNLFVEAVIAGSGKNYIYENKELLK